MKAGKVTTRARQKRNRVRQAGDRSDHAGMRPVEGVVVPFSTTPAEVVVALGADCTARHADQLKATLLDQVDVPGPVSLDISAIERIDTVSLQLLTAFVGDRNRTGRSITWAGHNDTFSQAVRLLGLDAALHAGDLS